MSNRKYYQLK